jgi:hypothetical protein
MTTKVQTFRADQPGHLMAADIQERLLKGRQKALIVTMRRDLVWVAITVLALLGILLFTLFQWQYAESKFENNARVSYVKLSPDGTYSVDYEKEGEQITFFRTTIESKLSEFVEKRFSKQRDTITTDYGFASLMMGPALTTEFMDQYQAPSVAAKHKACKECPQVDVKVREIQALDDDLKPGSTNDKQYTTLVFALEKQLNKDYGVVGCKNLIITLLWQFRPMKDIVSRKQELRYNPLGQEILKADVREDPSPLSLEQCINRSR